MSTARGRLVAVCMALVTVASSSPALADPLEPIRLAPSDIASLAKSSAGPGTSGISAVRSTVLSGNPGEAGPYTIALHAPAGTTEPAGQPHFARTGRGPAGVFITGNGPSDTEYVDAAADPTRR